MFLSSVSNFKELFDVERDPEQVVVDFCRSRISDHSGLEVQDALAEKIQGPGHPLHLRNLTPECQALLRKAGSFYHRRVHDDNLADKAALA